MNFFKILLSVNKVKRQLNNLLSMVKGIVYRLDEIEKDIANLKQKSHPPVFTKTQYTNIDERVQIVEAFINNLEKIAFDEKDIAN